MLFFLKYTSVNINITINLGQDFRWQIFSFVCVSFEHWINHNYLLDFMLSLEKSANDLVFVTLNGIFIYFLSLHSHRFWIFIYPINSCKDFWSSQEINSHRICLLIGVYNLFSFNIMTNMSLNLPSYYKLSFSHPKYLGPQVFQISNVFGFWNICTYIMRYLGDDTQV